MNFSLNDYKTVAYHLGYPYRDRETIGIYLEELAIERGEDWVIEVQQVLGELNEVGSRKSEVGSSGTIASVSIAGEYSVSYETGKTEGDNLGRVYSSKLIELINLIEVEPNWNQAKLIRS
ncbi:MAG: hypothetical protein ACRCZS_12180 [Chroococcidiopsis sp.]